MSGEGPGPRVLPALDAIADEPGAVRQLPPDVAATLFIRAVLCGAALLTRIVSASEERRRAEEATEGGPEVWLSPDEVTRRFGLSARWLATHRRVLAGRRIISRPSRKTVVYHARRLARFLEERSLPPGS